jgi:hypothetical protein
MFQTLVSPENVSGMEEGVMRVADGAFEGPLDVPDGIGLRE